MNEIKNKAKDIVTIELGKVSKFLSGRSRAKEAVEKAGLSADSQVCVNFSGVESVAQSFVSELLISIYKYNIDLFSVKFEDIQNDHLQQRLDKELRRMKRILNL